MLIVFVESRKLVGFVPPSVSEVTFNGTRSPPVFCTQTVWVLVTPMATSSKSTGDGVTTTPGSPISAGHRDVTRSSSINAPPSQFALLPAFRRMALNCPMLISVQVASQLSGSLIGMPSPRQNALALAVPLLRPKSYFKTTQYQLLVFGLSPSYGLME